VQRFILLGTLRNETGRVLSEYEFSNVLDASYGAYVVSGSRSGQSKSANGRNHNDVVATIRELVNGETVDIRLSAREASTAISIVQTFSGSASSIAAILDKMEGLATKASGTDYTSAQIDDMQKEFESLAIAINGIAKSTEHDFNNLFTAGGKAISISIGDSSKVDIFTKDLSFEYSELDLTSGPKTALSEVKNAIKELSEYRGYLNSKETLVEKLTAMIELEIESAAGVRLDEFTLKEALETNADTASRVLQNSSNAVETQGNVEPSIVLHLLKDDG
jgi:flagellin-like hook-associated protein FlgL